MTAAAHYPLRSFRWDDLEETIALINLCADADRTEQHMTADDLRHQFAMPGFDPLTGAFCVTAPDGRLVGVAFAALLAEEGRARGGCSVHPDFRGQGIGTQLIRAGEAHILELAARETPPERTIHYGRMTFDHLSDTRALFEAEGYRHVRSFYTMQIDLDTPLDPPALPDGIALRPFDPERDAHAVYEADLDAFSDHWGGIGSMTYERWRHLLLETDAFDAALWLVAVDGETVAGISLCRRMAPDRPHLGWVDVLGVRKPWRRRGLGSALLRRSFYEFQQRGLTQAGLSVDSANTTNAVALYERAGMHIHTRLLAYRKTLRGSDEALEE